MCMYVICVYVYVYIYICIMMYHVYFCTCLTCKTWVQLIGSPRKFRGFSGPSCPAEA